jgi:trehalose 6-phosphate phosphatase
VAVARGVQRELVDRVRRAPGQAGILVDFDGTLSPIVDDPASAMPLDGARDALDELSRTYKLVAVLSGRPVAFLAPHLPPTVVLSGLYGLEVLKAGRRTDHPQSGAWREVIDDVATLARARGPEGMEVEPKGLSLTLHFRRRPQLATEVRAWADAQSARSGLQVRDAKMSVELHPPIQADKGTAVEQLASKLAAVCFVGDDLGDLPAFDALDRLAERGASALRVAVDGPETPPTLVERADAVVDGPAGVLQLLRELRP